jgi:phosphoribosylformimino-5-aminoimidazole carboxamide ribotide isomerase
MRIIPVIDLKGGHVVHAVGGRRDEYRPIRSPLVDSSCPEIVARAFRDRLNLFELYVADLDAIAGAEPAWDVYRTLAGMDLGLMVDAGVRGAAGAQAVQQAGVSGVVVGLETIGGPRNVHEVIDRIGADAVWFSLDLKHGLPLGSVATWRSPAPASIVAEVESFGITRIIVLDLANVGERRGLGTEELCRRIVEEHPRIQLVAGGGIRDDADIERLDAIGVSGALVATALHSGQIRPRMR